MNICEAFHNILTYTGPEFTQCISSIFQLLLNLIADEDEQVVYKAKENDEILKAKFQFYFEKQTPDQRELISEILRFLQVPFQRENMEVKGWVLGWLKFIINQENNFTTQFFSTIVSNLIVFLQSYGHDELKKNTLSLLSFAQKKYLLSDMIWNVSYNLDFVHLLLENYVNKNFSETQRITTIEWCLQILKTLLGLMKQGKVRLENVSSYNKIE